MMISGRCLQICFTVWAGWRILIVVFFLSVATNLSFAAEESQPAGQPAPAEMAEQSAAQPSQASLDEAINLARQKITADPSSVQEQVSLGFLLLKKGALAEAQKVFDDALALNNNYHDALTGKGIVLARMGKDQEAEELFQKALVLNPNPVRTHYELGFLYEKRADYTSAVAEYKKGIEKYQQGRK
jgi:tetratricopeptide (TPR) repeat protein